MNHWLPRSLFARLVIVLLGGLVLAQAAGLAIYWHDRDEFMQRAFGMRSVQRIGDIVRLLDTLSPVERNRAIGILNSPQLRISLDIAPLEPGDAHEQPTALFVAALRRSLGEGRPVSVRIAEGPFITGPPAGYGPGMMRGGMGGFGPAMGATGIGPAGMFPGGAVSFVVQTPLNDGTLVTFDSRQQKDAANWSYRLIASLAILLVTVTALALIAVRWITLPLNKLSAAAEHLGENIDRPPLDEVGPVEVQRAARAFNTMQQRISKLVAERAGIFAAMSHDLKTPITRLRLRAELLDDARIREKFERDLLEMEQMVGNALDLVRGLERQEAVEPVDVPALLDTIAEEVRLGGASVAIAKKPTKPYPGRPQALRRCFVNLVENAVKYGGSVQIDVNDTPTAMEIRIRDRGPGIPEGELEKVFDPFYRLESSRSRDTGGTGLGLTIARNIVRAHKGELTLRNVPEGGLEAIVTLPR